MIVSSLFFHSGEKAAKHLQTGFPMYLKGNYPLYGG